MPRHILLPLYRASRNDKLLEMVCRVAVFHSARVTSAGFVVIPMSLALDDESAPGLDEANRLVDGLEAEGRRYGVKLEGEVFAVRDLGAAIVQASADLGADLIVMEAGLEQEEAKTQENRRVLDLVLDRAPCEVWVARM